MKKLETHYDVVVIGAGIGGLTAAVLLSKAGLSVCVLGTDHPKAIVLHHARRYRVTILL